MQPTALRGAAEAGRSGTCTPDENGDEYGEPKRADQRQRHGRDAEGEVLDSYAGLPPLFSPAYECLSSTGRVRACSRRLIISTKTENAIAK